MIRLPADGILYHGSYTEVPDIDLSRCKNGSGLKRYGDIR